MSTTAAVATTAVDNPADTEYDLVGVGLGPFNLGLAALAEPLTGLRTLFLDGRPAFAWHPGLLLEGAQLQVPFLADLVTLVDPTSRWSFLSYLRAQDRLFPFYFAERFHVPRREFDHYCVGGRPPTVLPVQLPGGRAALVPRVPAVPDRGDRPGTGATSPGSAPRTSCSG